MKKIIFVGDLNIHSRSFQRYRTLREFGHKVDGISSVPISQVPGRSHIPLIEKLAWKMSLPLDLTSTNRNIKKIVKKGKYDIVWIEKGNTIKPFTLRYIRTHSPETKLVSCSEDDMYASHNHSLYYRQGLRYYDIVFTTKTYNLNELKLFGARRVVLFLDAYDEKLHRPMRLNNEDMQRFGCDVGFIGTFEKDRALKMLYLAENGIKVVVWGNGWKDWSSKHPNLIIKDCPLLNEDYTKAINAIKINLCFLRKRNRDETTSRSAEIPACGGFMLGEKTKRHLQLFEQDKEAVFFDSNKELLFLVRKYLKNEQARKKIARFGRRKCIKAGYNHRTQLQKMLREIFKI